MSSLSGKIAIVTGGARGLGEAQARALAALGARVAVADVEEELGRKVAQEVNGLFVRHDVRDQQGWLDLVAKVEQEFGGPIGVLVNNAGIAGANTAENCSLEDYERFMAINATGPFLGMKSVVPSMKRGGGGSIVNISSIAGLFGTPNNFAYVASKFAVRGMTKAAALDLADYNIRVNSVHPGTFITPMALALKEANPEYYEEFFAAFKARTPLRRAGEPAELAQLVAFLASDASSYCTGAEFTADGGATVEA